jgi:hypothetical protein
VGAIGPPFWKADSSKSFLVEKNSEKDFSTEIVSVFTIVYSGFQTLS